MGRASMCRMLCCALALLAPATAPAAACVEATLTLDAARRNAVVQVQVARAGTFTWHDPALRNISHAFDASAGVARDAIVLAPLDGVARFTLAFGDSPRKIDRVYTPWIRFGDGGLALYTGALEAQVDGRPLCWTVHSDAGIDRPLLAWGRVHASGVRTTESAPPAYVLAGLRPEPGRARPALAFDASVPDQSRATAGHAAADAFAFFAERAGAPRGPVMVAVVRDVGAPGSGGVIGDQLPGAVLVRLRGDAWDRPTDDDLRQLRHVVAHELFHHWNAEWALPAPDGDTLLAIEGGAELAAHAWQRHADGAPAAALESVVTDALNECRATLPASRTLVEAAARGTGRMPYDCGLALVLAASLRPAEPVDAALHRFFRGWARLADRTTPYRLRDALIAFDADVTRAVPTVLDVATHPRPADALADALIAAGAVLEPSDAASLRTRKAIAGALLLPLMRDACDGRYGFSTRSDAIELDGAVPCRAFPTAGVLTHVEGAPIIAGAVDADRRARARCGRAGATVAMTFAGHTQPWAVPCSPALQPPPLTVYRVRFPR